jgi:ABC-type polysaccharide/polyol phosphate export permease
MQSRKHSLLESCMNVFSGMLIAFFISQAAHEFEHTIQQYIWAGFEWKISAGSNIIMTTILTAVSIFRGYVWRRHFNKRLVNEQELKRNSELSSET